METITSPIDVVYPDANDLHLKIRVGACKFRMERGDFDGWVTGTYTHPEDTFPAVVTIDGGKVRISQDFDINPLSKWFNNQSVPTFDLAVNDMRPFALTLEGGASEGYYDLGGLPITRLNVNQGAGKFDFDFSEPNPEVLDEIDIDAGAVKLEMRNLGNANFRKLKFNGGASKYLLDFHGALEDDAEVEIETGVSSVDIIIPAGMATRIISEVTMGSSKFSDGFVEHEGVQYSKPTVSDDEPVLTIRAKVALGSLNVKLADPRKAKQKITVV